MLSANVAVGVVNAFRDTARKEDIKVREALEEAVVDWLAKHDALDAIDLKAGAHNKVVDDEANEDKDTEGAGEVVEDNAEDTESDTESIDEDKVDESEYAEVDEPTSPLPMPRPDYNL